MVEDIPDHAQTGPLGDFEHVLEGEHAVVVLDHEPRAGALGEPLDGAQESDLSRLVPAFRAATWRTTTASGPSPIASNSHACSSTSLAAAKLTLSEAEFRTTYCPGWLDRRTPSSFA